MTPNGPTEPTGAIDPSQLDVERLLAIALETFAEFGWRDSTVDALCRRANITTAQFYARYETLDDLFVEMYEREAQGRVEATRRALQPLTRHAAGSTREEAIAAVATALGKGEEDRNWWIVTTEYMLRAVRHPEVATRHRDLRRSNHEAMVEVVSEALQAAGIADRIATSTFVDLTAALHRGALGQSLLDPETTSPQLLDRIAWAAVLGTSQAGSQSL